MTLSYFILFLCRLLNLCIQQVKCNYDKCTVYLPVLSLVAVMQKLSAACHIFSVRVKMVIFLYFVIYLFRCLPVDILKRAKITNCDARVKITSTVLIKKHKVTGLTFKNRRNHITVCECFSHDID